MRTARFCAFVRPWGLSCIWTFLFMSLPKVTSQAVPPDTTMRLLDGASANIQEHDFPPQFHSAQGSSAAASDDGVSACLMLRDENHQLSEWLAYHYHLLPLRHLVVALDPTAMTSPLEILERWTDDTDDGFTPMDIAVWDITEVYKGIELGGTARQSIRLYFDRQKWFVKACAQYHKRMGRKWVLLTDPDEYVTLNTLEESDPEFTPGKVAHLSGIAKKTPAVYEKYFTYGINYTMSELEQERPDLWQRREEMIETRQSLMTSQTVSAFGRSMTLVDFINQSPSAFDLCTTMPRVQYMPTESPEDVIIASNADEYGFDPMKFRTLRYFHHDEKVSALRGKVLIDVSRTPMSELEETPQSIHTPFPGCGWMVPRYEESILRIHHYMGTYEEYSYKRDCRRSDGKFWRNAKKKNLEVNHDLQYWLGEFVNSVGIFKAQHLLQGAGDIPPVKTISENGSVVVTFDDDDECIHENRR